LQVAPAQVPDSPLAVPFEEAPPAGEDPAAPVEAVPPAGEELAAPFEAVPPAAENPAAPPAETPGGRVWPSGRLCGKEFHAFQAFKQHKGATYCAAYCVPKGQCQGLAETGKLAYLGINASGDCRRDGFTESFEVANETKQKLLRLWGACRGMAQYNFVKPGKAPTKASLPSFGPHSKICQGNMMAYEAHHPLHPGVCGVYCVPEGECEGLVQSGKLPLGITVQGNCRGRGFTKPSAEYGLMGENILDMLKGFRGACQGMTYAKFEKPLAK